MVPEHSMSEAAMQITLRQDGANGLKRSTRPALRREITWRERSLPTGMANPATIGLAE